jgi:KTSC domain
MERMPVRSSNVASVGYDSSSATLEVEFHGGRVCRYANVPEQHFAAMTDGVGSVGKYFSAHVKNRYRYRRVS